MFAKKGDDWGRMFSFNEWIPKLFPNLSEYNLLRDTAMKFYNLIKVFLCLFQLQLKIDLSSFGIYFIFPDHC